MTNKIDVIRVPNLRFNDDNGDDYPDWEEKQLSEFLVPTLREVPTPSKHYLAIGIRSHCRGTFQKPHFDPKTIAMEKLFLVRENDLIVNITFAWEGAIAMVKKEDDGGFVSHRFPTYAFDRRVVLNEFFKYVFVQKRFIYTLGLISPGGAGRNRVLSKKELLKVKWVMPVIKEQQKITSFLSAVDNKIQELTCKKELLEQYKSGVMQKIFDREIRFKDENGKDYSDWDRVELNELLDYEQPTKYLVETTDYRDDYQTPVLTAGKTFILGYSSESFGIFKDNLPVIIFDDFTTAFKFVDFNFKAKSSAMKILKAKNKNVNISYVYESMKEIRFPLGEHKRYWISEYQYMKIGYPCVREQQKIASFLSNIDSKIQSTQSQLTQTQTFKKGLLRQMFI